MGLYSIFNHEEALYIAMLHGPHYVTADYHSRVTSFGAELQPAEIYRYHETSVSDVFELSCIGYL